MHFVALATDYDGTLAEHGARRRRDARRARAAEGERPAS